MKPVVYPCRAKKRDSEDMTKSKQEDALWARKAVRLLIAKLVALNVLGLKL